NAPACTRHPSLSRPLLLRPPRPTLFPYTTLFRSDGDALLDGRQVRPREPVRGGEQVRLAARLQVETAAVPQDIPLRILHEDDHVLVLDKPAGLVVHPGAGNADGTLVNALLHRDPSLAALPRAGVVHRLDKEDRK